MLVTVIRTDFGPGKPTFGLLDVDGQFVCHTLEDEDRNLETNKAGKLYGQTAIPRGKYVLVLDFSHRFKRVLPHALGVPGFEAIRIHSGNTVEDTHGCVLVGMGRAKSGITPGSSGPALVRLMTILTGTKDKITLEVK